MFIDDLSSGIEIEERREKRKGKKEKKGVLSRTGVSLHVDTGQALGGNVQRYPRCSLVIFSVISYFTTFVPLKNVPMDRCLVFLVR